MVSNSSKLFLIFNTKTRVDIQYDRGTAQSKLRMALVHTFTGISMKMTLHSGTTCVNPINLSNIKFQENENISNLNKFASE
jgi:hypothetical protein